MTNRLDALRGNYHVKRAIEVACAGGHTITLIASGNYPDAVAFAAWANEHGATATVIRPCACGNLGSPDFPCFCTLEGIDAYRTSLPYQDSMLADIHIQVMPVPLHLQTATTPQEPDEWFLERIAAAKESAVELGELDAASASLMRAACRQLIIEPSSVRYNQVMAVAATISRLAGRVSVAHLAEALQYLRRRD